MGPKARAGGCGDSGCHKDHGHGAKKTVDQAGYNKVSETELESLNQTDMSIDEEN